MPLSGVTPSARQDTIHVSPGISHNMNAGISLETQRLQTQQTGVFRHKHYCSTPYHCDLVQHHCGTLLQYYSTAPSLIVALSRESAPPFFREGGLGYFVILRHLTGYEHHHQHWYPGRQSISSTTLNFSKQYYSSKHTLSLIHI